MSEQARCWSEAATAYESHFVDPYRPDVSNPLTEALQALAEQAKTAADLGCGTGPLLPLLSQRFDRVIAVDFAAGMLERARERCAGLENVTFVQTNLTDLGQFAGQIDVAFAVNSLVMADVGVLEASLDQVRRALAPGGRLLAIVPAVDAIHYQTMLMLDRARRRGMPLAAARQNAALHVEHSLYDFAFGEFRYLGLEQHFWQPFEVPYRLRRAGMRCVRLEKVALAWEQLCIDPDMYAEEPPWDWFFEAEPL